MIDGKIAQLNDILIKGFNSGSFLKYDVKTTMLLNNNVVNSASSPRLNEDIESGIRHDCPNKSDVDRNNFL